MKKVFYAVGIFILMACLLCICFLTAILLTWRTSAGLLIFAGILISGVLVYGAYLVVTQAINSTRKWLALKRYGRNRLERLLWRHWRRGGKLLGWGRFWRYVQGRGSPPPWFLVTGIQGGGQRGLLANSHVPSQAGVCGDSSHERWFTCRWWFFRSAMYLVLSANYTHGNSLYRQAWLQLTRWMARVRSPSGVVLCLPISLLLEADSKARLMAAHQVREQLEPLQHRLGHRLPVWVVITQSEILPGFQAWSRLLSGQQRREILGGFIRPEMDGNCTGALEQTLHAIIRAIKASHFCQVYHQKQPPEAAILRLPELISQLQSPLREYLNALFEHNHYQQHSLLRGLFFTATEISGTVSSGIFSQQLLEGSLPEQPAEKISLGGIRYRRSRLTGLLLVLLIVMGITGSFLSFSSDIQQLKCDTADSPAQCDYQRYRLAESWTTGNSGLFYPVQYLLRQHLADQFLHHFSGYDLWPDNTFSEPAENPPGEPEARKRQRIISLARFINTETAIMHGVHLEQLQTMPAWSVDNLTGKSVPLPQDEVVALLLARYRTDHTVPALTQWRDALQRLLGKRGDWSWLLNDDIVTDGKAVTMSDFWPLISQGKREPHVNAIYTQDGERDINLLLDEVGEALGNPETFIQQRAGFITDYHQRRQSAWLRLAQAMPEGETAIQGRESWRQVMRQIVQGNSPYVMFFQRLATDMKAIQPHEKQRWLIEQERLWQLHHYNQEIKVLQQAALDNFSLRLRILRMLGLLPAASVRINENTLTSYRAWRQQLHQAAQQILLGDKEATLQVQSAMDEGQEAGKAGLRLLLSLAGQWQHNALNGQRVLQEPLLWYLWQGDNRLVLRYALYSAADRLQKQWEKQVVWPIDNNVTTIQSDTPEGAGRLSDYSNNFVRESASWALNMNSKGITRKEITGIAFPFTDTFMRFINELVRPDAQLQATEEIRRRLQEKRAVLNETQGNDAAQESGASRWVPLTFTSQPTTANRGAQILPVGNTLTLICNGEMQRITSINFSDSTTLRWDPASCQQLQLDIQFPGFQLSKVYSGPEGIASLLRALSPGELSLEAGAFPGQRTELALLGINHVTVRYQLEGVQAALAVYQQWQQQQRQQQTLKKQRLQLDEQLLDLNTPRSPAGTVPHLPVNITTSWNSLRD